VLKFVLILCGFYGVAQDQPVIAWNESYRLSWSDFKDKPDNNDRAVAVTASGITFGFSVKQTDTQVISFTTNVLTHFYPEQSWYKVKETDTHVLGHEQLHFDITELYARKFRQRISQLKVSNAINSQLNRLHEIIKRELSTMQDAYDTETDFSRNVEQQAKWKEQIATELAILSR
jgi:hypothetical protein